MGAATFSGTSVNFYQTTQRHIPSANCHRMFVLENSVYSEKFAFPFEIITLQPVRFYTRNAVNYPRV